MEELFRNVLRTAKTLPCPNGIECPHHKQCFYFHPEELDRVIVPSFVPNKNQILNCEDIVTLLPIFCCNHSPKNCKEKCTLLHEDVGLLFHPLFYKTLKCHNSAHNGETTAKELSHCPYFHSQQEKACAHQIQDQIFQSEWWHRITLLDYKTDPCVYPRGNCPLRNRSCWCHHKDDFVRTPPLTADAVVNPNRPRLNRKTKAYSFQNHLYRKHQCTRPNCEGGFTCTFLHSTDNMDNIAKARSTNKEQMRQFLQAKTERIEKSGLVRVPSPLHPPSNRHSAHTPPEPENERRQQSDSSFSNRKEELEHFEERAKLNELLCSYCYWCLMNNKEPCCYGKVICVDCSGLLFCEQCFSEYHSRGLEGFPLRSHQPEPLLSCQDRENCTNAGLYFCGHCGIVLCPCCKDLPHHRAHQDEIKALLPTMQEKSSRTLAEEKQQREEQSEEGDELQAASEQDDAGSESPPSSPTTPDSPAALARSFQAISISHACQHDDEAKIKSLLNAEAPLTLPPTLQQTQLSSPAPVQKKSLVNQLLNL